MGENNYERGQSTRTGFLRGGRNHTILLALLSAVAVHGNLSSLHSRENETAEIRVAPQSGSDTNDGRTAPVKTIARAIRLAQPGDTIHLAPSTYYESADFTNKHGLPDQPITLDGHGAILDGSEAVSSDEWEPAGPDLYRKANLYPTTDDAIVSRWFLLWDGKMQRMARCSKGPSEPLKTPEDLQPGEWTFAKEDDHSFYLKLKPGQKLDEANIRYPKRSSAVIFSRAGSHLVVKNVTGTHVYNDGFNIHGAQRNLVFENIAAIHCGDDGFSAHEDGDCRINGFVSIGNATGLCDTGTSRTYYKNVFIKDCHGFDLYFIGLEHSLENALIESSAAKAFWLDGNQLTDGQRCRLTMKNVLLKRVGGGEQELRIGRGGMLHATRCTFEGVNVMLTPMGSVDFQKCVFRKGTFHPKVQTYPNTIWRGAGNVYDLASLRVVHQTYTPETFSDFQKLTGSEAGSEWTATPAEPKDTGADETRIAPLKSP